jgi:hypothetical protein
MPDSARSTGFSPKSPGKLESATSIDKNTSSAIEGNMMLLRFLQPRLFSELKVLARDDSIHRHGSCSLVVMVGETATTTHLWRGSKRFSCDRERLA